jgi:hypothetical protein
VSRDGAEGGWVGREGYETAKDVMYTCAARIGGIT